MIKNVTQDRNTYLISARLLESLRMLSLHEVALGDVKRP